MVEEEEDSLFDQRELLIHNRQTHGKFRWKQKALKTVALSMAFFCMGLCIAIPGPTLLELGRRVHRDTEHMTFIFTARSVGFLIGSLVGGVLFDFFDQQILLFYTLSIVAVATAGVPWCTALLTLSSLICTQGVAIGVLDTGGNVFCIKIWGKRSAPFMQVLHFVFGIGALLAPLIARPFLLDAGLLHNATVGSYHPVKVKSFDISGHRFIRDLSAANYLNKGDDFDKFYSDFNEKISNYDTGQHALGLGVPGFNANWHKDYFLKNTGSSNKKDHAALEYGKAWHLMNVHTKRHSSDHQTVIAQQTRLHHETQVVGNDAEGDKKQNLVASQPAERPKKPGFSHDDVLSMVHADAVNFRISDLRKNAAKNNPDSENLTRMKRDSSDNQTVIGQKTTLNNETQVVGNDAEANKKQTLVTGQPAERPKKPDVSNGVHLDPKLADAQEANARISDLKQKASQNNPDVKTLTMTKVTVKADGWNMTSGVNVNGSYVLNGTDDVSFPWTSSVSSATTATHQEPQSSTLPTSATTTAHQEPQSSTSPTSATTTAHQEPQSSTSPTSAETSDSVSGAAIPAEAINASTSDTPTVTSTGSSHTPTVASTLDTTTTPMTTSATTSVITTLTTTISPPTTTTLRTTTTIPTITITTTAAPTSSTTISAATNSTRASGNVTASITTSKSTAIKPETTGDFLGGVITTITGMSKIQVAYTVIGLLLAVTSGFFLFLHCKDRSLKSPVLTRQTPDVTRNPFSTCFVVSVILLLFVFFLAYMGMEATFGGLLTTFAVEYSGNPLTPSQGASLTALFWGSLAFGRGCSIFIARCVKPSRMMLMNLGLTMFAALILSFSIPVNPATLWVGTVMLGLGMSSLFPTAISWANSCYPLSGRATAVFVAGSGVGEMTFPILTGYLYEMKDKMYVMYMMLFLSSVLATLFIVVQVMVYQKVKSGQRKSISAFVRLKNIEDADEDGDLGIAEGINLGVTETIWRRRLQGEEERGQEHGGGSKFAQSAKLIEM
ncbi:hypothetical protein BsWGS_06973 [Bradybaena similaris]